MSRPWGRIRPGKFTANNTRSAVRTHRQREKSRTPHPGRGRETISLRHFFRRRTGGWREDPAEEKEIHAPLDHGLFPYANKPVTADAFTNSRGWLRWFITIVSGSIPNA